MSSYCRIHHVAFQNLIDTDADDTGFYLDGKVDFIVTDPPYNTRNQRSKPNSSHDVLTDSDMKECVVLFDRLLKKGAHGLIFCSSLQFHKWFKLLKHYTREEKSSYDSDSDSDNASDTDSKQPNAHSHQRTIVSPFHVEEIMMHFQSSPGHYNRNPAQFNLGHMSVVQTAIHFWKKGKRNINDDKQKVKYEHQGYIPSHHFPWTNYVDNIPRIDAQDRIYLPREASESQRLVRPEQKSVLLLMELISQYKQEGDLVVDMFGGTFSAAKACLKLPHHRKFVGCDLDGSCIKLSMPSILSTYAKQLCSNESSISGTDEQVAVATTFLNHPLFLAKQAAIHASPWNPPPSLPLYQRLPEFVHRYLASETMDATILFNYRLKPPDEWPNKFRACLNGIDVRTLLNIEAVAKGFVLAQSSIRHKNFGISVFAAQAFAKGACLLTYYGTIVYKNYATASTSTKEYGSGILAVRKQRFSQSAVQLLSKVEDDDKKEYPVFIVPAPFCVASCINDPRYLPGDKDWMERDTVHARKPNAEFIQNLTNPTKKALRTNKLLIVQATREIAAGEEIFIAYGALYRTWGSSLITHIHSESEKLFSPVRTNQ